MNKIKFTCAQQPSTFSLVASELTKGILFVGVPGKPELITRSTPTISGGFSLSPKPSGMSATSPTTQIQGYYEWSPTNAITASADYSILIFASTTPSTGNGIGTHNLRGDLINTFSLGTSSVGVTLDNNPSAWVASTVNPTVYIGLRRGNQGNLYVGGLKKDTWTTGTRTQAFQPLIGRDTTSNNVTGVSTYLMVIWNRALSDTEILSLSSNPWQIFQPITKPLFVPLNTEVYSGTIYTVSLTDTTASSDTGSSVIFAPQLASQLDSLATVEGTAETGTYSLSQSELLNQFDGCTVITISADTQISVPDADVSAGSWVSSNAGTLVSALDETSYDDGDYIYTTSTGSCTISVAGTQDPQRSTGHYIKYRLLNGSGNVTVQLIVESTQAVLASWGPHALSGSPQDFTQTLTAGEADSITNYGDLAIKIIAS